MNSALRRHQKIIVLLVCLFIHALFMTGIVVIQFNNDDVKSPTIMFADLEPEQKIPSAIEDQWVALSNSLPAAPSPMPAPPQIQTNAPHTEEKPAQLPEAAALNEALQPASPEQSQEEIALEKSVDEAISIATQQLKKFDPAPQKKEQKPAAQKQPHTPVDQSSKELTLADIAQGFVNQVNLQAAMEVKSNTQGTTSMDQLKHLNYCQKIISCLVNSYKINKYSAPKEEQTNRLCIQLVINENGSIHTLRIVQSSGNPMLDQFLIDMFKDASSSFPPVPQSFSQKPYHLPLFNIDHI